MPRKIPLSRFINHFCDKTKGNKKYCFILGAGASKESGIPTGKELAEKWLNELSTDILSPAEFNEWKEKQNINIEDPASSYSDIYDERFKLNEKDGFATIEKIIEEKEPSIGYSFLAQILAFTNHNTVVTTNFDSLIEDALFIYTQKKPLVIGHEKLADYIQPNIKRPLIIKIHRDVLYSPISNSKETNKLAKQFKEGLKSIFHDTVPLIIGYGGNDGSLMDSLEKTDHFFGEPFWFYKEGDGEPKDRIKKLISKFNGFLVPINGFDNLMILIANKLELKRSNFDLLQIANKRTENYNNRIIELGRDEKLDQDSQEALSDIIDRSDKDLAYYLNLTRKKQNLDEKEKIYLEGLEKYPDEAELIDSYAFFLASKRKEYDKAEEQYRKAIDLNSSNVTLIGLYADFLACFGNDFDKAEEQYKKVIELEPLIAEYYIEYAYFLTDIRKDFNKAKMQFEKAVELDTENIKNLLDYSYFLAYQYNDSQEADRQYQKIINLSPQNSYYYIEYAEFLYNDNKNKEAEEIYNKAMELDPTNEHLLSSYVNFLIYKCQNFEKAKEQYEKIIKLKSINSIIHKDYADFLVFFLKDYDKAEKQYKIAIKKELNNPSNYIKYAEFLTNIRGDFNKAEENFKIAIELNPKLYYQKIKYADFLINIRKNYNYAEELYKYELEYESTNVILLNKYALLLILKNNFFKAKEVITKSFSIIISNNNNDPFLVLFWFYRYAIFFRDYPESKEEIEKLLKQGIISLEQDLSGVIEVAKKHNHPDIDLLFEYAKKISGT
jgi:protein O-mannosyl-transferase